MTDKEAIKQLRKLAKDLIHCKCFQSAKEWTEDYCEESGCKFLVDDDCEVQTRYQTLMEETNPELAFGF